MQKAIFSNLKGDIQGGMSSGLVTLLECIPLGLIAVAPLGAEYAHLGIIAAIYGSIIAGLFATLFGGTLGMITVPNPGMSLMFGYILLGITNGVTQPFLQEPTEVLTLAFFTVLLSGLIQLLMGVFKADYFIKFISYPVIAGIVTGVGILIVKTQVVHLLGTHHLGDFEQLNYWSLFIGLFTAVLYWNKSKLAKGPIAFLLVIAIGTGVYYLFLFLGIDKASLGPTIGRIPFELPAPTELFAFIDLMTKRDVVPLFLFLLPPALSLAVFSSLLSLLTSLTLKNLSGKSFNSSQELIGQGIGNLFSACFGGLPACGGFSRTMLNFHEGGRGKVSGVVSSLTILVLAIFFSFAIGYLPLSLVAGLMVVLGIKLIDQWALKLFYGLFTGSVKVTKELLVNSVIILVVVGFVVSGYLVPAIGIGVVVSIFYFLVKMRGVLIKRIYEDQSIPSKKMHHEKAMEYLGEHIHEIKVIELAGMIFFGAAENLSNRMDRIVRKGATTIILDMKRVDEIDLTGARFLEMAYKSLRDQGKYLAFSYLNKRSGVGMFLDNVRFFDTVDPALIFPDNDHALQYFEAKLLARSGYNQREKELPLSAIPVFDGFDKEEFAVIKHYLNRVTFKKADTIFLQGDNADSMYFLAKGHVDVLIGVRGHGKKRVQSFASGTFFGEIALFQKGIRSATVMAEDDVVCYRLSYESFQDLVQKHSHLSGTLLMNICRILSKRLLFINHILSEQES